MSKLIVFDVDGTILDSMSMFDEAALSFSAAKGLPPTNIEAIHTGYSNPDAFDFGWGVSKERQRELLVDLYAYFDAIQKREVPDLYDGVIETLKTLSYSGYALAVATSKPLEPLNLVLDTHDIRKFFATIRSWADIENKNLKPKPAGDMLQDIIDELGFLYDDVIMVGDTSLDILMAKAIGVKTIAVTWGAQSAKRLKEIDPDYILETEFTDILPLIEKEFPL